MTTDTKAAERLAERLAVTHSLARRGVLAERLAERLAVIYSCPPGEYERRGCGTALDACLDAHAVACWLAWARRDDEAKAGKERT